LFALTKDPAQRIVRFALSQPVQAELTALLHAQEAEFDEADQEIEFDGKYKPDDDEVLFIDDFDDLDDLAAAIANPMAVAEADPTEEFFALIKALFSGYAVDGKGTRILLQNFDKRRIISTRGLSIFHAANVYKKIEGIGLTVDYKLTAILDGNRLKFFSFHAARQIFDLSEYYKLATDEDVNDFAQIPTLAVANAADLLAISDSWVRRKISLIQQSGILQAIAIGTMKPAAQEFNVPFETIPGAGGIDQLVLPLQKADLKKVLRFLDEDYYKSPLSNTNFVTNSKRRI